MLFLLFPFSLEGQVFLLGSGYHDRCLTTLLTCWPVILFAACCEYLDLNPAYLKNQKLSITNEVTQKKIIKITLAGLRGTQTRPVLG
jgi:hypothetical protein